MCQIILLGVGGPTSGSAGPHQQMAFMPFLQQGVRNIPSPDIDCETKINVSREYLENRTRSTVNVIFAVITASKIITTEMNKKHCITLI